MNCNLYLVHDGPYSWVIRARTIYEAAALVLPMLIHTINLSALDGPKTRHAWKVLLEMVREDIDRLERPEDAVLTYDEIIEEYEDNKALGKILKHYKDDPDTPEVFLGLYGEDSEIVPVP